MSDYQANIIIKNPATPTGPASTGRAPGIWKLSDVAQWVKQGVWPDANIIPDQYFPYVSFLLSSTSLGNANNNLFVDSSGAFAPVSRFGNPTQGSVTPYSANWSNYFDGSGDYLTAPSNVAFALGTGDFTIEAWIFSNDTSFMLFASQTGGGVGFGYNVDNSSQGLWLGRVGQGSDATSGVQLTYNQWNHIAVTRQSGSVKFFVNGVQSGSTQTVTVNYGTSAQGFYVGRDLGSSFDFAGYASNARLVKGTAVYTGNFTVPTSPLTAISGTSLLTCQSNRFRDNSGNSFALTVTGNTSVSDFSPFAPSYPGISYNQSDIANWSGYFDANGDYGRITGSQSALQFGTGNYTIEGWVYSTGATGTYQQILTGGSSWTSGSGGVYWYYGGGSPYIGAAWNQIATNPAVNSDTLPINTWHHFAVVRNGNTLALYVNGTLVDTIDVTGVSMAVNNQNQTNIGGGGWDQDFGGYLSNLRVVKGTAVYTSNFTPPTSPLTAISGTSLLTLQNAAFTDNSTNNFVITLNGNVTVTGNSPFNTVGYWSSYFDGTSDWIASPSNAAFGFGTGDYTIECWMYPTSTKANMRLWQFSGDSDNVDISSGGSTGAISYYNGSTSTVSSSGVVNFNAWNHVACVRSSGTVRLYLNGVLQVTQATTPNSSARILYIAGQPNSWFEGYISNFRVVKGTAVYTSAFSPPTTPLAAISGTSLLTCQNGRFVDNSSNSFAMTINGNVSVQSFDPFYTATIASNGGSMYFDGTGDYLNVGVPSDWTFLHNGQVNWTLEYWAYNNNNTTRQDSFSTNTNSTNGAFGITVYQFSSTAQIGVQIVNGIDGNNFNCITTNSPLAPNCWNHVAVTFVTSTKTLNIYVNGVLCATTTNASYSFGSSAPNFTMQVGRWIGSVSGNGGYWNGYIANARIVRGEILYTSTFTPPTSPQNVTPATVLSLNGMNAGIYDATTINDMETVGNAQVSTVQSKFGGSSMYFDGSGDYLNIPATPNLTFGTSDFTLEMWIYSGANGTPTRTIGNGAGGTWSSGKWVFATATPSNPNKFTFAFNNYGTDIVSTTSSNDSSWHHVAVTRSGSTFRLFVDGNLQGTGTSSASLDNGTAAAISVGRSGLSSDADWAGYIDDLRITKGVARYTANFTPPDKAFPTY